MEVLLIMDRIYKERVFKDKVLIQSSKEGVLKGRAENLRWKMFKKTFKKN